MHVLLFFALPFILSVLADPGDQPESAGSDGLTVPLFKRNEVRSVSGLVNVHHVKAGIHRTAMKIKNALECYENNTGSKHPSAGGISTISTLDFKSSSPEQHPLTLDLDQNVRPKGSPGIGTETLVATGPTAWVALLGVGNSSRAFSVVLDTGSSDTFVPSISCNDSNCFGHALYDPSLSQTSMDLNITSQLGFGSGNATVKQFNETVVIAGLIAENQTIGSALSYSDGFNRTNFPADGLTGFAFQNISVFNTTPLFQNLVAQGQVSEPLFSVKLSQKGPSELCLGCINPRFYKGPFTYVPVSVEGFWQLDIESFAFVENSKVQLNQTSAIIDTGTTLIITNEADVNAIYAAIPGSQPADPKYDLGDGFFTIPCNSSTTVTFVFAHKKFPVAPRFFNVGPIDPTDPNVCVGGLAFSPSLQNITITILGDVFIQNYYVVFDVGKKQMGFADLVMDN